MSRREGTGSWPVGRRPDTARAESQRTNNYDEPPGPFPTLGHVRNRYPPEGLAAVQYRGNAGQVNRPGTPLTRVLAASLAAGTSVGGIPAGITQIIRGGTGGNGGNGFGRGIGGIGGVGQGPSFQIDNFSGTQIVILGLEVRGQVNQEIDSVLQLPVPRGVSDHLFWIMDPEGEYIPVSLRYCHSYQDLHKHIKTSLSCSGRAGASYVERGDYSIVSEDGSFIVSMEFAQAVKAYMVLEISILQRQIRSQSHTILNTTCPDCGTPAMTTGNGWFRCTTCMKNYRMDEQEQDMEEIMSPQLAYVVFIG
ncbi:hypothetical protein K438DRAFT_1966353 [Mycena galopus ATCC 62051]|nr:hypothetical protein K438DRAFT_1966353 [Mycena galopus ATCC 62051]